MVRLACTSSHSYSAGGGSRRNRADSGLRLLEATGNALSCDKPLGELKAQGEASVKQLSAPKAAGKPCELENVVFDVAKARRGRQSTRTSTNKLADLLNGWLAG